MGRALMAPRITGPLYITCEREACGAVIRVKNRALQQVQRFCSRRCATLMCAVNNLYREAQSRGGKTRAHRARLALIQRVQGLSPVEAFRVGYLRGLGSKHRQLARRVD